MHDAFNVQQQIPGMQDFRASVILDKGRPKPFSYNSDLQHLVAESEPVLKLINAIVRQNSPARDMLARLTEIPDGWRSTT